MEYLMFKNYEKFKQQNMKELKGLKAIWANKMARGYLIASLIIVASLILSLYLGMPDRVNFMIIVILLVITCYFVIKGNRYIVDKSDSDIEKLDKEYEQILAWLSQNGYIEKNQIKQLCQRCRVMIEKNKNSEEKSKGSIVSLIKTFFIPIYGALISWILGKESPNSDQITLVLAYSFGMAGLYVLFIGAYSVLNPLANKEFIEMQRMVNKIEGMLDRKFSVDRDDIVSV